ncbi:unnamed protein product [Coregonus sp. 'balchen']|nr:unnamed protein product [Coregonus sp. 'balchen']
MLLRSCFNVNYVLLCISPPWIKLSCHFTFRTEVGGPIPVGDAAMSQRRVSVKELGQVGCQGWLYRKKESKGFLGTKWKKYWFVLKKTSLYWYTCQIKAEGYINISDFTVNQATDAMKASHPQVVTLYFATESLKEINKWLSKLSTAAPATLNELSEKNTGGCHWRQSAPFYSEQLTKNSVNGCVSLPRSTSSPCHSTVPVSAPTSIMTPESIESNWLDVPSPERAVGQGPPLRLEEEDGSGAEAQGGKEGTSDEMEALSINLKQARLSPTGELKRDVRGNDKINEKLHLVRTLNSTLKNKCWQIPCSLHRVIFSGGLATCCYCRRSITTRKDHQMNDEMRLSGQNDGGVVSTDTAT